MIYLAPIQGFTDFIYRKAYSTLFPEVDKYFIPYISLKNNQILNKYKREILPENNPQQNVIPQILAKDSDEILFLSKYLKDFGYKEINLNMGCPYPMVTTRTKGSGLLPFPDLVKNMLTDFFEKNEIKLSIKLRAGLNSADEIEELIPVLNEFPLNEVIFHPRLAKQLYSGDIILDSYKYALKNFKHKLVYNGDLFSVDDYNFAKQQFPITNNWMLGRGILQNPFLPSEIINSAITKDDKIERLKSFHQLILDGYFENMDNDGNVLNKMKQFWSYFSFVFPQQKKVFKTIKKTRNIIDYKTKTKSIFLELY